MAIVHNDNANGNDTATAGMTPETAATIQMTAAASIMSMATAAETAPATTALTVTTWVNDDSHGDVATGDANQCRRLLAWRHR